MIPGQTGRLPGLTGDQPTTGDVELDHVHRNLEHMIGWVTMADQKALIALTFQGAAIAGLAVMIVPLREAVAHQGAAWTKVAMIAIVLLFLASLCVSLWKLFEAISPRIKTTYIPGEASELFFFGTVAGMDPDVFTSRVRDLAPQDVHDGLAKVTHTTAAIAQEKFDSLRVAYYCLGFEVLLFVLATLLVLL